MRRYSLTLLMIITFSLLSAQKNKNLEHYPTMADIPIKNVILMIGDGMGIGHIAAVRLQRFGKDGQLSIEKMPVTGFSHTHSFDNIITDSAASATAMSTGYKTKNGMLGMSPDSLSLYTIMEAAIAKGMKTGLVSTSAITHATPAAFVSHIDSRRRQNEIAEQMVNSGVDIMLGGGLQFFIPRRIDTTLKKDDLVLNTKEKADYKHELKTKDFSQSTKVKKLKSDSLKARILPKNDSFGRKDGLDLIKKAKEKGYDILMSKDDLYNTKNHKLLGLFSNTGLVRADKEPTLSEMTNKALDVLNKGEKGFFLMVEGSQIDWEAHDNNFSGVQREILAFDICVNMAVQFAMKNPGTLVIVTADHETGGLVIEDGEEKNVGLIWASTHHSGSPVGIYAFGPYAHRFSGVMNNTEIPRIIDALLDFKDFPQKED